MRGRLPVWQEILDVEADEVLYRALISDRADPPARQPPLDLGQPGKLCVVCGNRRPLSAFHHHHRTEDGRAHRCKVCHGLRPHLRGDPRLK